MENDCERYSPVVGEFEDETETVEIEVDAQLALSERERVGNDQRYLCATASSDAAAK